MSLQDNSYSNIAKIMDQYRKTPRARFLDYDGGDFFITICTRDKHHYFGEIYDAEMHYSDIGAYCAAQLANAILFNNRVQISAYVVMPNHIHAIVSIKPETDRMADGLQRTPNPCLRTNASSQRHVPILTRYISSLKGCVTKYAKSKSLHFGWQGRYYDHFIRGERDGSMVYEYILNNVSRWENDCFR